MKSAAPPFTGEVQTPRSHLISCMGNSVTANLWLLVTDCIQAQLIPDNPCHSNTALWQAGAHTDKNDCNSKRVSDPHQSGHHLITKAAATGCPTCLRWIQNHSLLAPGNSCFKKWLRKQQFHPDYGYQGSQSHTHFQDGCIFHTWALFAHRGAACWPIPDQSLNPLTYLEIMYDQFSSPLEKQRTQQSTRKWNTQPSSL